MGRLLMGSEDKKKENVNKGSKIVGVYFGSFTGKYKLMVFFLYFSSSFFLHISLWIVNVLILTGIFPLR